GDPSEAAFVSRAPGLKAGPTSVPRTPGLKAGPTLVSTGAQPEGRAYTSVGPAFRPGGTTDPAPARSRAAPSRHRARGPAGRRGASPWRDWRTRRPARRRPRSPGAHGAAPEFRATGRGTRRVR